ncbi:hypothetical protein OOT46_15425 [Aquabacterium sp. A7-Y]|uniref:extracellular catalytic domain type 2 short-chain-length polyhydroxyalkanoate depolymerase n=1 Tax=Aquabacterium sp. A7-Y TaxID=1349605 RepID=UPI00223E6140|nr:PHB depolymerase family esterase [Aquabacterium sp. A7-Y]MCW7539234.1 hypothetical protein [Aquabacterium sp. A7-Y]
MLGIDPAAVTVSGLSSGGYMAVQMQVAHSSLVAGAAAIAAGPYACAEGSGELANLRCLHRGGAIPLDRLVQTTRAWAASGSIDPPACLARARIYLFSGQRDSVVPTPVTEALERFLRHFVPPSQIRFRNNVAAEHAMVTDRYGGACGARGRPYIKNCGFDLAGELLQHLYGPLAPPRDGPLTGELRSFDQQPFARDAALGPSGRLFVPPGCGAAASGCRLHVVFHGCGQNLAVVGEQYVRETGYNRWAETNRIVVLYPQTGADAPKACWDWWGYTGPLHARKAGPQIAAIRAMVERLIGRRTVRCVEATPPQKGAQPDPSPKRLQRPQ